MFYVIKDNLCYKTLKKTQETCVVKSLLYCSECVLVQINSDLYLELATVGSPKKHLNTECKTRLQKLTAGADAGCELCWTFLSPAMFPNNLSPMQLVYMIVSYFTRQCLESDALWINIFVNSTNFTLQSLCTIHGENLWEIGYLFSSTSAGKLDISCMPYGIQNNLRYEGALSMVPLDSRNKYLSHNAVVRLLRAPVSRGEEDRGRYLYTPFFQGGWTLESVCVPVCCWEQVWV